MVPLPVHAMSVGPVAAPALTAPYSLGCLVARAKTYDGGRLDSECEFHPITPRTEADGARYVDELSEGGVFLFSSYVWNHSVNLNVAQRVRARFPDALIVFGGPQIPTRQAELRAFFESTPSVDVVVRGEGEEALAEILDRAAALHARGAAPRNVDLSDVLGVTRRSEPLLHTPDRPRASTLEALPSPYTTGLFDHWIDTADYMPLETNRGCPYGCTFCDWGSATLSKIRGLHLDRVFGEIEYAGIHHISSVYICDANFGILKRDVEIARHIIDVHRRYGYPKLVSYNNSKVVREGLQEIVKMLRNAGLNAFGQVSIQTTDKRVLEVIERSNIRLSDYDRLVEFFRREKIPALSELMVGLPGQTFETCKRDMQFLFDRRMHARIYPTAMMPNAPMAAPEYRERHAIVVDADGFVESTFSFSREEYESIMDLGNAYKLLANLGTGLLKYVLLYMQLERKVGALDYIERWLEVMSTEPSRYPVMHAAWEQVRATRSGARRKDVFILAWDEHEGERLLGNFEAFLSEALDVYASTFGVDTSGTDLEAMVRAQLEVMPRREIAARTVELPHDVPAFLRTVHDVVTIAEPGPLRPLRDYPPGTLSIEAGPGRFAYNDFSAPFERLERSSNLAF